MMSKWIKDEFVQMHALLAQLLGTNSLTGRVGMDRGRGHRREWAAMMAFGYCSVFS